MYVSLLQHRIEDSYNCLISKKVNFFIYITPFTVQNDPPFCMHCSERLIRELRGSSVCQRWMQA